MLRSVRKPRIAKRGVETPVANGRSRLSQRGRHAGKIVPSRGCDQPGQHDVPVWIILDVQYPIAHRPMAYMLKRQDGFRLFLDDGRLDIDSNLVENAIRSPAMNRRNALFAGHDEGGRNWARFTSLIGTCKMNVSVRSVRPA